MSTDALVQSWVDFPLNYEVILAATLQKGVNFYLINFSGLQALSMREDAGFRLLERYKQMNPLCIENYITEVEKGNYTFEFAYIEMLLSQDIIINKLDFDQKKQLVSEAIKKISEKKAHLQDYGVFGLGNSLGIIVRLLHNVEYQNFMIELGGENKLFLMKFLQDLDIPTDNVNANEIKIILNHANNFIRD